MATRITPIMTVQVIIDDPKYGAMNRLEAISTPIIAAPHKNVVRYKNSFLFILAPAVRDIASIDYDYEHEYSNKICVIGVICG